MCLIVAGIGTKARNSTNRASVVPVFHTGVRSDRGSPPTDNVPGLSGPTVAYRRRLGSPTSVNGDIAST